MKAYGTDPELDKLVDSDDYNDREKAALYGYGLDILINDEFWCVREAVAEQGYGLDRLIDDKVSYVRRAVAKQRYRLDKLINDEDWEVRAAVARENYGLDILIQDKDKNVREAAKYYGYSGYNSVINWAKDHNIDIDLNEWLEGNEYQRYEVARYGYRLDKLINDENEDVREVAKKYLRHHNYESILDWAKDNNIKIDLNEWLHSTNWRERREVAEQGYGLDKLVNDENEYVRAAVAEQGYGLDKLINDESPKVREAVAWEGYGLDKLILDKDPEVFHAVEQSIKCDGYDYIFNWIHDNGINEDILIENWLNSDDWQKRYELAYAGYCLDILILDENNSVREIAERYLKNHNYKSIQDLINNYSNEKLNSKFINKFIDKSINKFISNFINKIENLSMITIETNLESIDDFFNTESAKLNLVTIDTKISIITITKLNKDTCKFDLNVTDNIISSKFNSFDKFNKLMNLAINELNENDLYYKYAEELEQCL